MATITTTPTPPKGQQKLRTIMEAASALTALGDEEGSTTGCPSSPITASESTGKTTTAPEAVNETKKDKEPKKRHIPEHKKPDAALTFPEKLMNLMKFATQDKEEGSCIAWLPDGKSFVIRNPDEFTRKVLPKFFKATKFSSFTRKLYRWGFRQVNRGIGPDDPIIFGNEHFQRDNAEEMSKMRSITAASSRKAEAQTIYGGGKRALDGGEGPDHKRALLDHLLQQKAALMSANPQMYAAGLSAPTPGAVSLTSALRPSLGLGVHTQAHFNGGGLPAMMSKHMDIMGHHSQNHHHSQQHNQTQNQFHNTNSLINNYMPQPVGAPGNNNNPGQPQQYPNSTSTADIVNAAISALRYAS